MSEKYGFELTGDRVVVLLPGGALIEFGMYGWPEERISFAAIRQLLADIAERDAVISACAQAVGASVTPDCSAEFRAMLPSEIKVVIVERDARLDMICRAVGISERTQIGDILSALHDLRGRVERAEAGLARLRAQEPVRRITLNSGALRTLREFTDCDDPQNDTDITIAWLENAPIDDDGNLGSGYFCWFTDLPEEGHIPIDLGPNIKLPWPEPAPKEAK